MRRKGEYLITPNYPKPTNRVRASHSEQFAVFLALVAIPASLTSFFHVRLLFFRLVKASKTMTKKPATIFRRRDDLPTAMKNEASEGPTAD